MYEHDDYIQTAPDGKLFGQRGEYKYRVMGRDGSPTHHTNSLADATRWFEKQRDYWIEKDALYPKPPISIDLKGIPDYLKIQTVRYLCVGGPSDGKVIELPEHYSSWLVEYEGVRYQYHVEAFHVEGCPPVADGIYKIMAFLSENDRLDSDAIVRRLFDANISPYVQKPK